jgi:hypothetical protein
MDILDILKPDAEIEPEVHETPKGYGPFDFTNSINAHKNLFDATDDEEKTEKEYNPWMVNKSLSYFPDCVGLVNIINENYHLDKKMQYLFLLNTITQRKRFAKWAKKDKDDDVDIVKEAFGYSQRKAEIAVSVLSTEQLNDIRRRQNIGGVKNEGNSKRSSRN